MYERVPNKVDVDGIRPATGSSPSPSPALKRRAYDDLNGVDSKCLNTLNTYTENVF